MDKVALLKVKCFHCGEDCGAKPFVLQEKPFCCDGCRMVYEILQENNLCTFYDLNKNPGQAQKIKVRENKFSFLDDVSIQQKLIQFADETQTHVTFYLPQMHCSSCLWLIEHIHKLNPGVVVSKVNFEKKEVFIVYKNASTTLRKIVETLTSIGYEPHISFNELNTTTIKQTNKSKLYKIGIAGFCFANIMMMSFPEYLIGKGAVEENIKNVIRVLVVLFSFPVIFYCATEFFTNAWKGLKHKQINIDAPIAIAILITFGRSIFEISTHAGNGYLDSMSGIVFFMLVGRWLQDKTYQSISFDRDFKSFFPIAVNVLKEDKEIPTTIDKIKAGDIIQIYNQELIPVDAILSKGNAAIDYSFVNGESMPVHKQIGEIIYAGGKQLAGAIELLVVKEVSQSYLTNLWNKDAYTNKDENSYINSIGKYFTIVVLLIAAIAATYWASEHQYTLMWNTLTTVLIVACPCALLLAATFTNGNLLRVLSNNNFYLRHADVIENMAKVNHIVFDKTGTITQLEQQQIIYKGTDLETSDKENIAALLMHSSHPLSKAISTYLNVKTENKIKDFKEHLGKGIEGWIAEKYYKIGSYEYVYNQSSKHKQTGTTVFVKIDDKILGEFRIENKYRYGFNALINTLKNQFSISILSGDNNDTEQQKLQSILGQNADVLFQQKPDEKLNYIKHLQYIKHKNVMMIGDGLNDAGALKQSNVGIAITENSNNFTPASDGILDAIQFSNLNKFIKVAQSGKKIILTSFIISILYNFIGLYFAVQGILSPVIAAILMPISSITIVLFTYGMSTFVAWKYKLLKTDKYHIS